MNFYITPQALTAIGTVIAALIASLSALITLTLTKENKTSEFRQAWIDGLRVDLSEFLAGTRACARAFTAKTLPSDAYHTVIFPVTEQQIAELRVTVAQTYYRIKLRLNPFEAEHIKLLKLLDSVLQLQNKQQIDQSGIDTEILAAIEECAEHSRVVLKKEWLRVKKGELSFRIIRNWLVPVLLLIFLLIAYIFFY